MQFTTAAIASILSLTASAAPTACPSPPPALETEKFGLITIRSGSGVQNSGVQAAQRSLFVNLPAQNATCEKEYNFATFFIQDEELKLYAGEDESSQTIFVDRSGMGQGKVGYLTGTEQLGRNWETKGWAVSEEHLTFDNTSLQACSGSIDGGWSLWLSGVTNPAGNKDCVGVVARVIKADEPVACTYTS